MRDHGVMRCVNFDIAPVAGPCAGDGAFQQRARSARTEYRFCAVRGPGVKAQQVRSSLRPDAASGGRPPMPDRLFQRRTLAKTAAEYSRIRQPLTGLHRSRSASRMVENLFSVYGQKSIQKNKVRYQTSKPLRCDRRGKAAIAVPDQRHVFLAQAVNTGALLFRIHFRDELQSRRCGDRGYVARETAISSESGGMKCGRASGGLPDAQGVNGQVRSTQCGRSASRSRASSVHLLSFLPGIGADHRGIIRSQLLLRRSYLRTFEIV